MRRSEAFRLLIRCHDVILREASRNGEFLDTLPHDGSARPLCSALKTLANVAPK